MEYLHIAKWDDYQSYRTDRGAPPWIKVHVKLRSSAKWAALSDAEKGQLVSLWLCAADRAGRIPADAEVLRKICLLDDPPDIDKFKKLGYLQEGGRQRGVKLTPTGRHGDAPEERRGDKRRENTMVDPAAPDATTAPDFHTEFDERIWPVYPKRSNNPKKPARDKYAKLRKSGVEFEDLLQATKRYALFCKATGKTGTETVMQAQTFFGPNERWHDEFPIPKVPLKLPADDNKLESFAREHGLQKPNRGHANYYQYREALKDEIAEKGL